MLTFTGFAASVGLPEAAAVPPFPINDPTNGTFGASDTYWQSSATSSVANTYTKDGWLRLTDSSTGQATNILNNTAFPSSLGFRVSFDYRQAGGIRFPAGTGLTGDGIAMYLVTGTSTISQGAAGAALGYGSAGPKTMDATNQMCTTPGVSGGYLGLGLDVYGNYASPNFGNGGGPGSRSGIGLRGSGDGCNPTIWAQRYPWVNGSNTMDLSTGASGSGDPAGVDNSKYRRVSITVVPSGSNVTVTVAMSELAVKTAPAGAMTQVFTGNLSGVTGQRGLPSTLKLGFSASTGSASDYHDIRNILVQAITDTSITKALDSSTPGHTGYPAGTFLPGDPISFTMTATNNGPSEIGYAPDGVARVFDDMRDLPITDVSWTCTASADATCANGDSGTGPIVSQDWTGKKGASVTVKVTGTVVAKAGSYTNTAILPTDFTNNVINPDDPLAQADGGAIDLDTNNNKATANFKVLAPNFTQVKTADLASYTVGQPITYTVVVTNSGTAPGTADLSDLVPSSVRVTDASCDGSAGVTCSAAASGGTVTGSIDAPIGGVATFTITGEVVSGPDVTNTATINPTTPTCDLGDCGGGDATTPDLPVLAPHLTLTKTATVNDNPITNLVANQTVTYKYAVTNDGQTPVSNFGITETNFTGSGTISAPSCPVTALAVGESTTCTATYTVTQADVDARTVTNTATAHGTAPGINTPTDSDPSSATLRTHLNPVLTLAKTATVAGAPVDMLMAGQKIDYSFVVTNMGNVTMSGIRIGEDSFTGNDPLGPVTCPTDSLAPGESEECTTTYTVTQSDVDQGSLANSAYAYGTAPGVTTETRSNKDTAMLPLDQAPAISVTKEGSLAAGITTPQVGDLVNFVISVANNGNVSLRNIDLTDGLSGVTIVGYQWPATVGILAPGATLTVDATYAVTQDDIDSGSITNRADVTADDPDGGQVDANDTVVVNLPHTAKLDLEKTGAVEPGAHQAGQTVTYTFKATNNGNVTLTDVTINDPLLGSSSISYSWPGTPGTLAPGQSVTGTASYVLKQSDMNAGQVYNEATVTGTPPSGPAVTGDDSTTVLLTGSPSVSMVKTGVLDDTGGSVGDAGDLVDYEFDITNTGNVTLTDVTVIDLMPNLSNVTYVWPHTDGEPDGTLAPGETATGTATYQLTQADVDAGGVTNAATVKGNPPNGPAVTDDETFVLRVTPEPSIGVVKHGELTDNTVAPKAGSTVDYTISITNNGNVTLTGVTAEDILLGAATINYTWPGTPGTLAPGEEATAEATYALTQGEIDAGVVENLVTVSGTPPTGPAVTGEDTNRLSLTSAPSISLIKTGSVTTDPVHAGDNVRFEFEATNDGNVTLSDVSVADNLPGVSAISYTWPDSAQPGVVGPGQSVTGVATYAATQADIDAGHVHNDATVTATPPSTPANPDPPAVTGSNDTDVFIPFAGALTMHKIASDANGDPVTQLVLGETVYYSFVVENTGNATVSGIGIDDSDFTGTGTMSSIDCPSGALAPGDSVTCTATYVVTQADVDAGKLTNTATAGGTRPGSDQRVDSPPDTVLVPSELLPALTVTKTDDLFGFGVPVMAGDRIGYTITAKNSGNVSLTGVTVTDALLGGDVTSSCNWPGTAGALVPGEKATCSGSYTLTQADIDAGTVTNTATGTGVDPEGTRVSDTGEVTTDLTATPGYGPGLGVVKTADRSGLSDPAQVGDPIVYTIKATNTGNLTLTGVVVRDDLLGGD
ncbi:MAG: hypothetical protein FWF36_05680, partial [Propionibacteriaceae bacterium]|nr:hypothetical protein [Propionibacteriaceae bacterium]